MGEYFELSSKFNKLAGVSYFLPCLPISLSLCQIFNDIIKHSWFEEMTNYLILHFHAGNTTTSTLTL